MNLLKLSTLAIVTWFLATPLWTLVVDRFHNLLVQDKYVHAAIYVAMVLPACAALFLIPFLRSWWTRVPLVLIGAVTYGIDMFVENISGEPLTVELANIAYVNIAMAGETIVAYGSVLVPLLAPILLASAVFALPARPPLVLPNRFSAMPFGMLAVIMAGSFATSATLTQFPSFYAVPAKALEAVAFPLYSGPRQPVTYDGRIAPLARHVVLIVDESVRGDYLSIRTTLETTPFLAANEARFADFGNATSSWNCSIFSRLVLRTGSLADQLPDHDQISMRKPTIWQYARKAGYQTVLLDGFTRIGAYHSYMTNVEAGYIDKFHHFDKLPVHERDMAMVPVLKSYLDSPKPSFILVNKVGVHWPYHLNYPREAAVFDAGPNGAPGFGARREHIINSYKNGIRWSVDQFFARLFAEVDLSHALIVYTSDHGQNFFENGSKMPHCTMPNAPIEEGFVPMLVISGLPGLHANFRRSAEVGRNRMTHFQVFPTLLVGLGYDRDWTTKTYGTDLLAPPPKVRRFRTGYIFTDFRARYRPHRIGTWIEVDRLK